MATSALRRPSGCPACAGPTSAPGLCAECAEAFAVARRAHPTFAPAVVLAADDMDMWDAWSLLGDVGGRPLRALTD